MNSEMVKYGMVMLTGREKTDITDADVTVGWMLVDWCRLLLDRWWLRGREKTDVA
jgi:hypothetical protein